MTSPRPARPWHRNLRGKRTVKRIVADPRRCLACRACELACALAHAETDDLVEALFEQGEKPRIYIESAGEVAVPLQCRHCEDAPCLEACMTGAMHRDPKTAAVICDEDKCVGCWMCIMVCPFGVIARNTEGKKVASKCDLCGGEKEPVCVHHCPNEAITIED